MKSLESLSESQKNNLKTLINSEDENDHYLFWSLVGGMDISVAEALILFFEMGVIYLRDVDINYIKQ